MGFALLEAVSHPAVAFNLDPGNMVSLCPQQDPIAQALAENGISASLEIPLRMHCQPDSWPLRADQPVDPDISLEVLTRSRLALEKMLGYSLTASH